MKQNQLYKILPQKIKNILQQNKISYEGLQEIRMREQKPLFLRINGKEKEFLHYVTREELRETMEYISDYSLYAYENELRQGFLTIQGGHRVGIAGKVIIENEKVKNFQYISSINIRICHEIQDCADKLFPYILNNGKAEHTLIISPPGSGKTTLLRDLVRQVSDGNAYIKGQNVAVVDERCELGGCYQGVPQNQLGRRTDILDCCPKAEGMIMLVRSMSPQILAVDEIGTEEDRKAISYAANSGVTVFATVHGDSLADARRKNLALFRKFIVLRGMKEIGGLEGIYDAGGNRLC